MTVRQNGDVEELEAFRTLLEENSEAARLHLGAR